MGWGGNGTKKEEEREKKEGKEVKGWIDWIQFRTRTRNYSRSSMVVPAAAGGCSLVSLDSRE